MPQIIMQIFILLVDGTHFSAAPTAGQEGVVSMHLGISAWVYSSSETEAWPLVQEEWSGVVRVEGVGWPERDGICTSQSVGMGRTSLGFSINTAVGVLPIVRLFVVVRVNAAQNAPPLEKTL